MTVTTVTVEVARYAAQVRAALVDLAPADRDELLEDLEGHLLEVRADDAEPLELRLGSPEAYAAELRASAGLAAPRSAGRRGLLRRADDGLRRDMDRLRAASLALPGGAAVADFLPELRPGWWVLRAWVAVWGLEILVDSGSEVAPDFPVPTVGGSTAVGVVLLVGALVASVRLGREQVPPRLRDPQLMLGVNVTLVLLALVVASLVESRFTLVSNGRSYGAAISAGPPGVLTAADGRQISNLYAFDSLGRPLRDVQLFDQDGRPVDTLALAAPDGSYAEPEYRLDDSGNARGNVFPRELTMQVWTDNGPSTAPVPPPAVLAPRLATPPPGPSGSPTPSPAASPS